MKFTLKLKQQMSFSSCPSLVELEDEKILANDVTLPSDSNPHNTRLFVIGDEYGPMAAVWARHEQDAFDELCDQGLSADLACDEPSEGDEDSREDISYLGNASEPHNLSTAWIGEADLTDTQTYFGLWLKLAEAKGACAKNLSQV
jgi:hypothetical protein